MLFVTHTLLVRNSCCQGAKKIPWCSSQISLKRAKKKKKWKIYLCIFKHARASHPSLSVMNLRLDPMCVPCSGFRNPQHAVSRMPLAHHANCALHSVSEVTFACSSGGIGCMSLILLSTTGGISSQSFLFHPPLPPTWPCTRFALHFATRTRSDSVC